MKKIKQALETTTAPRFSSKVLSLTKKELESNVEYLVRYLDSVSPRVSVYHKLRDELRQCRARLKQFYG